MFGGQIGVPMILRTQGGTGRSAHSIARALRPISCIRRAFVAMPATVSDAYRLLQQSLEQPDPVVFIEHKALYSTSSWMTRLRQRHGANHVRENDNDRHCDLFTPAPHALSAAETLAKDGMKPSAICTLNPLDIDTIRLHVE